MLGGESVLCEFLDRHSIKYPISEWTVGVFLHSAVNMHPGERLRGRTWAGK